MWEYKMKLTDEGLQIFGNKTRFSKKQVMSLKISSAFQKAIFAERRKGLWPSMVKIPSCKTTRTEIYAGFGWVSHNLGTGRMAQKQQARNNKQKTSKRNNVIFRISPALLSHLIIDE